MVLIYHRVGTASGMAVDLPVGLFRAQVSLIAESARAVTLDEALAAVAPAVARPARDPLVVTFDDGTADFVDVALPVMAQAGVPSLLYLATDFVERQRPFPCDGRPLSWAALRDALSTGLVEVGSHTHTHALLDRRPPAEVEDELDRATKLIEDRLGITPSHFAYPKALLGSTAAQAAVRRRFRSAAVAGTRPNRYGRTDNYRLARSPVQVADGLRFFRHKAEGGMTLEDDLRRVVNRVRYARASE